MSAKIWKMTGTETVACEVENFDLLDRWLRWVGYEIEVRKVSWEEVSVSRSMWTRDEPTKFVAFTHNTRDEEHHGPSTEPFWGDSQAEVMAKARKRRDGARKRQVKNWGDLNEARLEARRGS